MRQLKYLGFIAVLMCVSLFTNTINAQKMTSSNSQLSEKDKNIIIISSFTAQGKLEELKASLNKGLDAGLTINEIKEILVHTYAYCGFPRSIRGLQTFMEVLDERKAKGINDIVGKEASIVESENNKYERGKEILGQLTTQTKQPDKLSGYSAFAPTIDTFLKEHLFADIFERDLLTYAQRELVTISVISAIGNAEPMLQSHLGISLNVGWSPPQLNEFVTVISSTVSIEKSNAAKMVLNQVLKNKSK
ncbi:carboxymuconolactone decarboxylase (plasmid) [Chryseobacterium panacisoli]|uniref:Carboxymuconolactone decarboxylase n=1 Tax=Chryseobacterium panacisoli TaxID=1807141 RepID=A0A5D8ZUV8_9FLAO|nr:carboxymuconolactone decarboxylase family protein [Chryseobacterium panacisoli]TZF98678.1 carboxymuconolactone decarboxylase [Chryseobacterium panacisoli]